MSFSDVVFVNIVAIFVNSVTVLVDVDVLFLRDVRCVRFTFYCGVIVFRFDIVNIVSEFLLSQKRWRRFAC